jgi:hypothetical protein
MNNDNKPGLTDRIIAYEEGDLDAEDTHTLFQELIDNGMAWTLQGNYGRTAVALIQAGHCKATTEKARFLAS